MTKKNQTINLPLKIPSYIEVVDYHELASIERTLQSLNKKIKVGELGCTGNYIGLIYTNKKDFSSAKKEWRWLENNEQ